MRERAFVAAWLLLLLVGTARSSQDPPEAVLVGLGECSDCRENKIQTAHAFTGLSVTVDCKDENGEFITKAESQFDSQGKFSVPLPKELLSDKAAGKLNQNCYARILSSAGQPCPSAGEASKLVYQSLQNGKHTFVTKGKLSFSPLICTSATFWCQHPWLKNHPWCQKGSSPLPFPPISFPPKPFFPPISFPPKPFFPPISFPPKPFFPSPPTYETPPPTPILPPTPVPPTPVPTPVYTPPTPTPVYTPPTPTPKPPVYVKPPTPYQAPPKVYTPPTYVPPVTPKPCPPTVHKPAPTPVPKYPPYGGSPPPYGEKKN